MELARAVKKMEQQEKLVHEIIPERGKFSESSPNVTYYSYLDSTNLVFAGVDATVELKDSSAQDTRNAVLRVAHQLKTRPSTSDELQGETATEQLSQSVCFLSVAADTGVYAENICGKIDAHHEDGGKDDLHQKL